MARAGRRDRGEVAPGGVGSGRVAGPEAQRQARSGRGHGVPLHRRPQHRHRGREHAREERGRCDVGRYVDPVHRQHIAVDAEVAENRAAGP